MKFKEGDVVLLTIPVNSFFQTVHLVGTYTGILEKNHKPTYEGTYPLALNIKIAYLTFTEFGQYNNGGDVWLSHAYTDLFEEET